MQEPLDGTWSITLRRRSGGRGRAPRMELEWHWARTRIGTSPYRRETSSWCCPGGVLATEYLCIQTPRHNYPTVSFLAVAMKGY